MLLSGVLLRFISAICFVFVFASPSGLGFDAPIWARVLAAGMWVYVLSVMVEVAESRLNPHIGKEKK
jgi:hypothetical protein